MRRYFITGLVILLPVALTIAILIFLVNFLTGPFMGALERLFDTYSWSQYLGRYPGVLTTFHYFAQIVILIILFFFTVLLGYIGRWFLIRSFLQVGDKVLHRIPLVNKVYKTSQDIIKTLFASKTDSFKQVVMVEFPTQGAYCLGLVSSEAPPRCRSGAGQDLLSIFVPTTPNPTSGFLVMYPRERCLFIDMKVEDAIKYVISCGVIHEGNQSDSNPFPNLKPAQKGMVE